MSVEVQPGAVLLLTVAETCAALRISRWMFYELVRQGRIDTVKIGSRRLVPATAITRLLDDLSNRAGAA